MLLLVLLDTILSTGDNQARMLSEIALVMGGALFAYLLFAGLRALYHYLRSRGEPAVSEQ